jgi:hypothetical protein
MIKMLMRERSSADAVAGWRCLICGEATDPGVEANRMRPCRPVQTPAHVPETSAADSIQGTLGCISRGAQFY